jgi:hypothetical protein
MNDTTKRKRFRFSLQGLILVVTMVAMSIVAYREGYKNGYKTAKNEDFVISKSQQK